MNTLLSKSSFAIFFNAFLTRFVIKQHYITRLANARWTSYTSAVFFFPVKIKSARESYFWIFSPAKFRFAPTIWQFFVFFQRYFFFQFLCRKSDFFFQKPQSENQKCNFLEISRETILFNGHYLKVFWFFSRFFFRDKKNTVLV